MTEPKELRSARLSSGQERFWFLERLAPGNAAYHVPVALRLHGRLDVDALRNALSTVVARHEALRTDVVEVSGRAYQVVREHAELPLRVLVSDATGLDAVLRAEVRRPFDLGRAPLARALLVRIENGPPDGPVDAAEHVLLLTMHHIVSDAASLGVVLRELAAAYGGDSPGDPPALHYVDAAHWQQQRLTGDVLDGHLAFWRGELAGAPDLLELPSDRARPAVQSYAGATYRAPLGAALSAAAERFGASQGATPFMTFLAAFVALLHRHTGRGDIAVGSPVANRGRPELEGLVGFLVNTVALRCRVDGALSFRALLDRVRRTALACYEHAELPFEKLVDDLAPARDLSHAPLVQVMFAMHQADELTVQVPGLRTEPVPVDGGATQFDLVLTIERSAAGGQATAVFEYSTDLFDAATVARFAERLTTLLTAALADPDRPLTRLPLLGEADTAVTGALNDTARALPSGAPVHELVERQALRTPDAPALTVGAATLSYRELNERANRLARHLRARGVGPESLVAVALRRGPDLPVALLAVLKAGGAYLPVDPDYPAQRREFMLADSGATVVLTDPLPPVGHLPGDDLHVPVDPAGAAYLIYTSGSTGTPKGVTVAHDNLRNFVHAMDGEVSAREGSVWLATTSVSFDIAALELLWTLARGVRVVLRREDGHPGAQPARPVELSLFYFASADGEPGHERGRDAYRLLLQGARFADEHGFAGVWTPERHFHPFGGPYPNPAVTGAAVAAVTERVAIRAGSVVAPLQDPLRVAEEWSIVDGLSGGRAEVSFASGWLADDFVLAPDNHADRKRVLLDAVATVRSLWRGEGVTRRNGAGRDIEVHTYPRPVTPELPTWLTSAGDPATFETAGRLGAHLLTHLLGQDLTELTDKIARYRRAWRDAGHPGHGRVALMVHTYLEGDAQQARERARAPFVNYLRSSLGLVKRLLGAEGPDLDALPPGELDALLEHFYDRYAFEAGLLGSAASCQPMVERIAQAGVDEIACLIDFGVEPDAVLAALPHLDELRARNAGRPAEDPAEQDSAEQDPAEQDAAVPQQLRRHGVTHLQCTPSLAAALVDTEDGLAAFGGLEQLLVGGEAFGAALAARLTTVLPGRVRNMYGPTETTIWSTVADVAADGSAPALGYPVANTRIHLVDRYGEPVPPGVPGEVLIGGDGVVRGYHGRPALTAQRFVPDPFGPAGARLYRTGDLAVLRRDGTLEFRGRIDDQVKLRGRRIELGEVEAHLEADPGVERAVACVAMEGTEHATLVAYLRPRAAPDPDDPDLVVLPTGGALAAVDRRGAAELYQEIFVNEEYLDGFLRLWDGATVLDVGANVGAFTLFVHQRCRPGRLVAVEPIPPTFARLERTVRANGITATVLNTGVGAAPGTAAFTHYPELSGLSGQYADPVADRRLATTLITATGGGESGGGGGDSSVDNGEVARYLDQRYRHERFDCPLTTLSEIIREQRIEHIDLLKVDVERAELDVLAGLSDTDWGRVRQVCVEVEGAARRDEVLAELDKRGFETHLLTLVDALDVAIVHGRRPDLPALPATRRDAAPDTAALDTAVQDTAALDTAALRQRLARSLPGYLVPERITTVTEFPLTPNGKVDRRALAESAPAVAAGPRPAPAPPRTDAERLVAAAWCEVLGVDEIGVHENFFDAGGNSLLLIRVHARLAGSPLRTPRLVDLFAHPTVASLAAHLDGGAAEGNGAGPGDEQRAARREGRGRVLHGRRGRSGGSGG